VQGVAYRLRTVWCANRNFLFLKYGVIPPRRLLARSTPGRRSTSAVPQGRREPCASFWAQNVRWDTSSPVKSGCIILKARRQCQGTYVGCRARSQPCIAPLFLLYWIMPCVPSPLSSYSVIPPRLPGGRQLGMTERPSARSQLRLNDEKHLRRSVSIASSRMERLCVRSCRSYG